MSNDHPNCRCVIIPTKTGHLAYSTRDLPMPIDLPDVEFRDPPMRDGVLGLGGKLSRWLGR